MSIANTRLGHDGIARLLSGKNSIFFIGIGGISMSSLAHISHENGCRVGGSDRTPSPLTRRLEAEGISVVYTHDKHNIEGYDLVVYTVAISPDNPEYVAAREAGIPTVSRADYLGYLMSDSRFRVGIAGAHGKSTCTSMLSHALLAQNEDPTVVCGAVMPEVGGAYRVGGKEQFVFESCEYMDNFLSFCPNIAVILNIEYDHSDYFPDLAATFRSFRAYAEGTADRENGVVVCNADDENTKKALAGCRAHCVTFGLCEEADYRATDISLRDGFASFRIRTRNGDSVPVKLSVAGRHNIYNALASFAVCDLLGLPHTPSAQGIGSFTGCERRMEYRGRVNGAAVYEDYAHHPTEILATLRCAKEFSQKKILAVFQPHTYSRTAELFDDFVSSLRYADRVLLADIYAARESNTFGVSSDALAETIGESASCPGSFDALEAEVRRLADDDTLVLILGAGDICALTDRLCGKRKTV